MSYIDPSSLAASPSYVSPSPSPSSHNDDLPSSSEPSRKRPRTEVSTEERKEARAHRNRIAAQNSRDRRKAQFTFLERRVQELEDENRHLRAGIHMPPPPMNMVPVQPHTALNLPALASLASVGASAAVGVPLRTHEEDLRMRRELERERENEELKERIKTLERGWDAVVKALAAQGMPTGISTASPSSTTPTTASSNDTALSSTTSCPVANSNGPHLTGLASFPSPAPSHASIDVTELDAPSSTPFALQPSIHTREQQQASPLTSVSVSDTVSVSPIDKNSTRHLARVASIEPSGLMALQRSSKADLGLGSGYLPSPSVTDDDDFGCDEDAKMEDLFREIFVETTAPTTKDETVDCNGIPEASASTSALWPSDASEAQVNGQGNVVEGDKKVEGSTDAGLVEGLEQQSEREGGSAIGEKRKREDDDQVQTPAMSDEEMQRMLGDIEVSMMMGNFDPSLSIPLNVDNFGNLDMTLLGFEGVPPFIDFASGPDFGNMWAATNSTPTGVF